MLISDVSPSKFKPLGLNVSTDSEKLFWSGRPEFIAMGSDVVDITVPSLVVKFAMTRTVVLTEPELTVVFAMPLVSVTADVGARLIPPRVDEREKLMVWPSTTLPFSSIALKLTKLASGRLLLPKPARAIIEGEADVNWIAPITGLATVITPVALLPSGSVAVMVSCPVQP